MVGRGVSRCIFVVHYSGTQTYLANGKPTHWLLGFHNNTMPEFVDGSCAHPGYVAFLAPADGILRSLCITLTFANEEAAVQTANGLFEAEVLLGNYAGDHNCPADFSPMVAPEDGLRSSLSFTPRHNTITNRTVVSLRDITNEMHVSQGTIIYVNLSLCLDAYSMYDISRPAVLPFNVHAAMTFEI